MLRRVTDPAKVWPIWAHPEINRFVVDDFSGRFPMPEIVKEPNVVCLMPDEDSAYFIFVPFRPHLWEVHGAVLPLARPMSVTWAKAAARWMATNTPCRTILSFVPAGNFKAAALDRSVGFKKCGVVPKSHQLGGSLHDMSLYALEV